MAADKDTLVAQFMKTGRSKEAAEQLADTYITKLKKNPAVLDLAPDQYTLEGSTVDQKKVKPPVA